ncbi:LPXTG cell wall anchor domain-containing protein [Mammaliicoccus sciuri]|uniref:LPXTG cell wall anchor domain-containing protein n=1 Tax=Mammaliicoccus sciuri TaxID=1296 RepID=UPI001E5F730D|nr:LPXTG cell wall anchor domain-containing protein [Mammaliicoccus sciuri]MCD8801059.1 LPXTG cell wall anchor domain-containing protein [Mammaliicoccus sciuri]MEB7436598.1 LPXTG cell wall anchor domain-containing protein [Mammaliicoccus sciuri]MEB7965160.1 LPXTG cell wall anchor domain-containing protein [Mammaliicoccus sciuri]MEB8294565.1 LPXTG cell wall anchor domain-containing protein [Mammaliicoccus sciuri]
MLKKIILSTLLCTTLTTPVIGKVNAEEVKQDKPVKYVFHNGGMLYPIRVNYDGSMTVPEQGGEILEIDAKPGDFYIYKDGVPTNELNPKYKHIWDQWGYYDFYKSKGKVNDLFVGEHPRPLDGVTYDPKSDKTSDDKKVDDQKVEPKSDQPKDQPEPNKKTTDNQSMTEQPKQDVPAKVEQSAKVDKKSNSQGKVVDKKDATDTNKDNKVVANNKSDNQNKVAMNNQKSESQSSDVSKKVDVKKEDNNKDVKAKSTDSKAKAADNKSDKQQKELPKTGESENPWIQVGLLSLVGLSLIGLYTIDRKSKA